MATIRTNLMPCEPIAVAQFTTVTADDDRRHEQRGGDLAPDRRPC